VACTRERRVATPVPILLSSCSSICTPAAVSAPEPSSHRACQYAYRPAIASRECARHADGHSLRMRLPWCRAETPRCAGEGSAGRWKRWLADPCCASHAFQKRRGNLDIRRKMLRAAGAPWVGARDFVIVMAVHKVGRRGLA
jgi:hypothetical protein